MSNSELNVHYYLKCNERRADGTTPVLGRITVGKSMVQFAAKVYVPENLWNTQSGRVSGKSKAAPVANKELAKIALSIYAHHKELLAKKENTTATDVKNAFQGIASLQETLLGYCDKYNTQIEKRVGVNLTLETYKRYGVAFNHIRKFLRAKYNLADIPFQALDLSFIKAFDFYLFGRKQKCPLTSDCWRYHAELLRSMQKRDEEMMPCNQKINDYLKEVVALCGINKQVTFHLSRHSFSTTVTLGNGVPLETVSKMLGHTNIRTTQI